MSCPRTSTLASSFDHLSGLVHLLLIDKNDAGHDQRLCALTALCQAMLNKILIQPNLHDKLSPFVTAICTACTRCAASRPVACLICATLACGRHAFRTAQWIKRPFHPFCCKAYSRCSPMLPFAMHSSANRIILYFDRSAIILSVKGYSFTAFITSHANTFLL